jgi:hypothetical protein
VNNIVCRIVVFVFVFVFFLGEGFFLNLLLSLECDGLIVHQDTAFVKNSGNTTTTTTTTTVQA